MPSILKLKDKPRTLPWRAKVKGGKVRMFASKDEAARWANEYERTLRLTGLPPTIDELRKHTVRELVERYLKEKTPLKGCAVSETTVLKKFLKRDICSVSLATIKKADAYRYRDDRLKEAWRGKPITPRTVRREVNTLQHIFATAKEEWGFENLENPFRIKIERSTYKRKRRLKDGELEELEVACGDCRGLNKEYVLLAIYLAIETGMRLQEIFNLTWRDVDVKNRRIEITKSKTDHVTGHEGRTIVMNIPARGLLAVLRVQLIGNFRYSKEDRIFPMTREAFKQSWADVVKRAGITDLHFHDLRREAGSRFDEAGLTRGEHDLMMGHANKDMASLYVYADLKSIQDKLALLIHPN
ncbi:MAG: site-specific integrase [Xanthobacteraceae bacterium]